MWCIYSLWYLQTNGGGARGRYLDYFLHFWGLGSKRGNVKPSYLMEIHSEIGTLFHILVHHDPNTGEIVMKCAVYIVYNICKRIVGGQRPLSWLLLALFGLGSKRGNVKPSYLMELHSEIGTLFHILVHHGPNTGEIVMKFAVYIVYNICKRMEGTKGRYLDHFLHFRGLESKRGNVKPSYLIEIHSEIATLLHILVHHVPNTGQIVMKFAVYIVYNICQRMEGARGRYLYYFLHFKGLESKRGNVKPSYLIEIHSEIGTLFHILVHHGPNTGAIIMKCAVYIVYDICKRMEGGPEAVISTTSCTFGALEANGVMSNHRIWWKYTAKSVHCFILWSITARMQARSLWNLLYI